MPGEWVPEEPTVASMRTAAQRCRGCELHAEATQAVMGEGPEEADRTNVVKHSRFSGTRGKQRIHKSPSRVHVAACGPWLLAELDVVRPTGVVLLGAPPARRCSVPRSESAPSGAGCRPGRTIRESV